MFDGRAETDHVHARISTTKNAALKARVDGVDDWLFVVKFLIDFDHQSLDIGIRVGSPTWVRSAFVDLKMFFGERRSNRGR